MAARRVVFLVVPGCVTLDLAGPLEVFSLANRLGPPNAPRYRVELVAPKAGPMATSAGVDIVIPRAMKECRGAIDTLVVVGGLGIKEHVRNTALIGWLRRAARRSRRGASACGGGLVGAGAGSRAGKAPNRQWAVWQAVRRHAPAGRV